MRAVVQRVSSAEVWVEGRRHSSAGPGLLVYLGVATGDGPDDLAFLVDKVRHLRIFPDADDKMNLDVAQAGGEVMVVSAFTVQADARRGRRPSFDAAARPEEAQPLVEAFCEQLAASGLIVRQGVFAAYMDVASHNDGPICILLDSRK
ncbi:MAG: D-tyrosyl-tRNA(Tyr) deacylase [Phycisphaerae bacterium]|nr:D-tyrosyl-tRNA(Tyr) deacylase [Phycisphaerae bacterium]